MVTPMLRSMLKILSIVAVILAAASVPASAIAGDRASPAASLYDRLGGKPAVSAIVSDLVDRVERLPQTRRSFEKVNIKRLKRKIEEQICALTGGPCQYTGDTMKQAHAGLNITESEFYGLVEALIRVLDQHGVGDREKNQLLAILAPMKRDIVTR